jgi:hypothetical protein
MRSFSFKDAVRTGEVVTAHIVAAIVGFAMMVVGIGMGVTMFLIPVAIPVGIVGLGIFLWGVAGFREARKPPPQ